MHQEELEREREGGMQRNKVWRAVGRGSLMKVKRVGQRGRTRKGTRGEKLKRGACRKGLGKWQGRGTWGGGGGGEQ